MSESRAELVSLVRVVHAVESTYPYVTADRIRRVARAEREWTGLTRRLAGLLRAAVDELVLFCDDRQRLRRDGSWVPVRLYRLNRRHPLVQSTLD